MHLRPGILFKILKELLLTRFEVSCLCLLLADVKPILIVVCKKIFKSMVTWYDSFLSHLIYEQFDECFRIGFVPWIYLSFTLLIHFIFFSVGEYLPVTNHTQWIPRDSILKIINTWPTYSSLIYLSHMKHTILNIVECFVFLLRLEKTYTQM